MKTGKMILDLANILLNCHICEVCPFEENCSQDGKSVCHNYDELIKALKEHYNV